MPATYTLTPSPTTQQIVDSIRKHTAIGTKIEIQLSSGCFIEVRIVAIDRVGATISLTDYYTDDAVEHKINPSTREQLNTLLVLTYGTDFELVHAGHATFYTTRCTVNLTHTTK